MTEATHARYAVKHAEDAGHLKRVAETIARAAGASEAEIGRVGLTVSELVTNLLRHAAPGGIILMRPIDAGAARGIETLSVDTGPGMRDARACMVAGPSKPGGLGFVPGNDAEKPWPAGRGGLGVGLASVERLSTVFDVDSTVGHGTVVLSRHFFGDAPKKGALDAGAVSVARPGESVSGDGWATRSNDFGFSALVVDGLGHGPDACSAAEAAIAVLNSGYGGDLEAFVRTANTAMRRTRGGVLAIARIDLLRDEVQFVGVGNIEGSVILPDRRAVLTSRNGTVGVSLSLPDIRIITQPWGPGAVLILHSDGVRIALGSRTFPRVLQRDPAVIAAVAMRDGFRGTDDATVLVVKDARFGGGNL